MNIKITLLLVIALLSVSTSPIIAKFLNTVPAISISFWRMFIGAILLWSYSFFKKQGAIQNSKNYSRTVFAGILLGFHFALFFGAIKLTLIANATFLGTRSPNQPPRICAAPENSMVAPHIQAPVCIGIP